MADCALLVIDSTLSFKESYPMDNIVDPVDNIVDPASLAISMGMDLVEYSEIIYNRLKDKATTYFKSISFEQSNVTFVSVSALEGDSMLNKSEKMNWYEGHTLIGKLQSLDEISKVMDDIHIVVNSTEVKGTVELINCRVHYGVIESSGRVAFFLGKWVVDVDRVRVGEFEIVYAWAGEDVELQVKSPVNVMMTKGCVGVENGDNTLKLAMSFKVEMLVTNSKIEITTMLHDYLCSCHKAAFQDVVSKIKGMVDPASKRRNEDTPRSLKIGQIGVVSLTPLEEVILEKVCDYPSLVSHHRSETKTKLQETL
ncbi:putative protein-synthesizing GTPase [Helianthus debilis subsp. tardiflorus]